MALERVKWIYSFKRVYICWWARCAQVDRTARNGHAWLRFRPVGSWQGTDVEETLVLGTEVTKHEALLVGPCATRAADGRGGWPVADC